eukprot:6331852-Amphidinium_carterae.1
MPSDVACKQDPLQWKDQPLDVAAFATSGMTLAEGLQLWALAVRETSTMGLVADESSGVHGTRVINHARFYFWHQLPMHNIEPG